MKKTLLVVGAFAFLAFQAFGEGKASSRVAAVGPGYLVYGLIANPGVGGSLAMKLIRSRPDLYFGIDSGLFFQTAPTVGIQMPVLAMAYHQFSLSSDIVPTLGAAVGIILNFGTGSKLVDFMLMVNPGFQFAMSNTIDLFFRSSLGFVGSTFAFYPQVGATLRL